MKKCLFILFVFLAGANRAQVYDFVVDLDGTGNFSSIQEAVNAVPDNLQKRTLIFVKNGIYYEKVLVSSLKKNISLIGQSVDGVKLTYDDNPGKGISPAETYTMHAAGDGFYAENITIQNSSGDVGQAIAIRTTGDSMVFKNCRFIGFQDTYYAHKNRQYNLNCTVEGATDFIYGDATCVFDSCTINCVKGGSYISAPADTKLISWIYGKKFLHGLLLKYCNVKADDDVPANSYFLGRPWQPDASSVYIHCMLGEHIKPEGWSTWSGDNHLSSVFAEYLNSDSQGNLADVSQRVSWSSQLDSTTVAQRYDLGYFLRKNGKRWDPVEITKELYSPMGLTLESSALSWNSVENAIGYVIEKAGIVIGFSATNSFVSAVLDGNVSDYKVKTVNANGNLSTGNSQVVTGVKSFSNKRKLIETCNDGLIRFTENVEFEIYSISGLKVREGKADNANMQAECDGIYIVYAKNNKGDFETRKIVK